MLALTVVGMVANLNSGALGEAAAPSHTTRVRDPCAGMVDTVSLVSTCQAVVVSLPLLGSRFLAVMLPVQTPVV